MKNNTDIDDKKVLVLPADNPCSEIELAEEIRKAEKGPFFTVEQGMKDFEQWLETREKK